MKMLFGDQKRSPNSIFILYIFFYTNIQKFVVCVFFVRKSISFLHSPCSRLLFCLPPSHFPPSFHRPFLFLPPSSPPFLLSPPSSPPLPSSPPQALALVQVRSFFPNCSISSGVCTPSP